MAACADTDYVLAKLAWMREQRIWPNGLRYLWTDAFGVILLVSLYRELHEDKYFAQAEWVVAEVERVLGRPRGIRICEEPDRDGQYFGYGLGALDAFDGYVSYRLLDEATLSREIADMRVLAERSAPQLVITQDLGIGMMLWMTHFFPAEPWARIQQPRCLATLDGMWREEGYFCREPYLPDTKIAFSNYGVSVGLQAVDAMAQRVQRLNAFFEVYRSGDEYDRAAITHVMACSAHFPGCLIRPRVLDERTPQA